MAPQKTARKQKAAPKRAPRPAGPAARNGKPAAPALPIWQGTGRGIYPRLPNKKKLSGHQKRILKREERKRIRRWVEENLPPQGTPEWEAVCTRCGECCADKVWMGTNLIVLNTFCQFLDRETNMCTCFGDRFDREPLCMPIDIEIIMMGGLPEDCPYVAGLPGYRGPIPSDSAKDMC